MKSFLRACLIALSAVLAPWASAETYPSKPIRLVVPYPPGALSTAVSTLLAERAGAILGQPVVLDYRPGANGSLAANAVAKAPADGHTIMLASNSQMTVNPHYYSAVAYDPKRDFVPISVVMTSFNVLVVNPSLPAGDLKELIALAKEKPGQLVFGSAGNGSTAHLSGEMFKTLAGTSVVHAPYKGVAPALTDLMGGQIAFMFADSSSLQYVTQGRLRALAVTSGERVDVAPSLPTMEEAGLKGFRVATWFGLVAPAGTPPSAVTRLNAAFGSVLLSPEIQARWRELGIAAPRDVSTGHFAALIDSDYAMWKDVLAAANLKRE